MTCTLCPRRCHAERLPDRPGGCCASPSLPIVAKAMLHEWEEPCLTGAHGAGAVFFSGCNLRCVYCQNHAISRAPKGQPLTPPELRSLFKDLVAQGASCLDLVTPTHYTPAIIEALGGDPWPVPIVWNTGGYESADTLHQLRNKVNVYLPDLKYALPALSESLSSAPDYFDRATEAIEEMYRQTGPYRLENGLLTRGILIRHLILPGHLENTRLIIDWLSNTFRPGEVLISLMRQYTPQPGATGHLTRRVTGAEYRAAVEYLRNCGLTDGYTQDPSSAVSAYTPDFCASGGVLFS